IAQKSVQGTFFSIGASLATLVIGFTRAILLARLLLPADFGLFTFAMFFTRLIGRIQMFGFSAAFVHRSQESDEDTSAHFILRTGAGLIALVVALLAYPLLTAVYPKRPLLPLLVVVMTVVQLGIAFNSTPFILFTKRLNFRRLSLLKIAGSLLAFIIAISLAQAGWGVWSLVGQEASIIVVNLVGLWLYKPPWRIRIKTSWETIKWYMQFGWSRFLYANLVFATDRLDDFWVGNYLGEATLGFYSKAYEFARYPRAVIATPLINVFFPTFAALQHDRDRLSKAFFRVSSLIVRGGFLLAAVFIFVAPEFIRLFLGEKWLPMMVPFQLMLVYTLLDPLLLMWAQLVTAVGEPELLTRISFWQLLFFIPALLIGGNLWGINGVAVAANLMLIVGAILLLPRLRHYVDFSIRKMAGIPFLAILLALGIGVLLLPSLTQLSDVMTFFAKLAIVTFIYGAILYLFERQELLQMAQMVSPLLRFQEKDEQS
ncbi:MAG: oligosaccharide flippase family protein, partial [Chloroflexi bacterium]|nr:oligosaccharide flippase family protein [Chloroflexota bacterium]